MSLLTLIQAAARALNIAVPTTVVGNADLNVALMLRLAQEEGEELSRRHDWQGITLEKTHTTLAQVIQTAALPTDYDRLVFNAQIWNRSLIRLYAGPTGASAWQQLQARQPAGTVGWWRIRGGALLIYPAPTAGETIAFEYVSKNFVDIAAGGTSKATWTIDTDIGLIPERLMTLGVIWRWKQTKGLAYAEDMATYERDLEKVTSRDRGAGTVPIPSSYDDEAWPHTWQGTITP